MGLRKTDRWRSNHRMKGVFCLEGDWIDDVTRRPSVEPLLALLQSSDTVTLRYAHRDVATVSDLEFYLSKWIQRKLDAFPILYLAFHGDSCVIRLREHNGKRNEVDLDWFEERLAGRCQGRVIHFGSCGTLDVHGNRLRRFVRTIGATAVCGYRSPDGVDWLESAAFEILLFAALQQNSFTRSGALATYRQLRRNAPEMLRNLNFRMEVRS